MNDNPYTNQEKYTGENQYRGIQIFAPRDLHEICAQYFLDMKAPKDTSILILASGHGSFDQRLIDNGFENLFSIDMNDTNKSTLDKNRIMLCDLNENFSDITSQKTFDYIFAIEIIEHLYDHNKFVKECAKLLAEDGTLFITSPNIESVYSKLYFLLKGNLPYFGREHMPHHGHITPVFIHILEHHLSEHGMYIERILHNRGHDSNTLKSKIFFLISRLLSKVAPGSNEGINNIFVIKKKDEKKEA